MNYMYLLYVVEVLHILLLWIYIIYIELCAGINEKQQNPEKYWGLCRVYAHGKGHFVTLACTHTRQRRHVVAAYAPGTREGVLKEALPCALGSGPRQRSVARHSAAHGNELPHGKDHSAR
jgi:hypothetical protein